MSTFTGDATITLFDRYTVSNYSSIGGGTAIVYDCPVGRFAEVQVISASGSSVTTGSSNSAGVYVGGHTILLAIGDGVSVVQKSETFETLAHPTFWLNGGESCRIVIVDSLPGGPSAIGSMDVYVKEYNKP
jgi:hypothetical protein